MSAAGRFRALHRGPDPLLLPNPWDVGSARILAGHGFRALATTSAGFAFSRGRRDGRIGTDGLIAHAAEIAAATGLPVSADLETGYGADPDSVARTIRAAHAAGLAGCSIEDHGGDPDRPIFDRGLAVERITAAVEACRALPDDFVLTARAENFLWGRRDLDDTLERLAAFEAAGADVLYAPGLPDLAAIEQVCSSLRRPVNVVTGLGAAGFSVAELAAAGVGRISIGSALARLAYGAVIAAAREMRAEGSFGFVARGAGFAEIEAFFPDIDEPVG